MGISRAKVKDKKNGPLAELQRAVDAKEI